MHSIITLFMFLLSYVFNENRVEVYGINKYKLVMGCSLSDFDSSILEIIVDLLKKSIGPFRSETSNIY